MRRRTTDLLILLLVLIIGFFALRNARAIGDWVHGQFYSPPSAVSQLAEDAGMNDTGKELFYRFSPQIVGGQELDQKCSANHLGCTAGRNIYILASNTKEEANRNIVTAAHEMLHVAYSRLSKQQIEDLEPLFDTELKRPQDSKIVQTLQQYDGEDYYNEAHSYIGSQLDDLAPALEEYYADYFSSRENTVIAYRSSPEY